MSAEDLLSKSLYTLSLREKFPGILESPYFFDILKLDLDESGNYRKYAEASLKRGKKTSKRQYTVYSVINSNNTREFSFGVSQNRMTSFVLRNTVLVKYASGHLTYTEAKDQEKFTFASATAYFYLENVDNSSNMIVKNISINVNQDVSEEADNKVTFTGTTIEAVREAIGDQGNSAQILLCDLLIEYAADVRDYKPFYEFENMPSKSSSHKKK